MLFNANEFIFIFLPIAFLLYHLTRRYSRNLGFLMLTLVSLTFYGYGEPRFILLLLASVTINYFIGCRLIEHKNKALLTLGIAVNVIAIGYFKYANFLIENTNSLFHSNIALANIALPLGISFYTFQKIAFLVEAYRSEIRKPKFIEYLLFVSFFPQLIAGPIVHFNQIESQIRNQESIPLRLITSGIFLYCIGLFKKSVFADFAGVWADYVFDNPLASTPEQTLLGSMAYTLQIYFDFSGYSDMAIGLGMMFGIVLPINFNSPYQSKSIVEFWQRWHITLSTWLRNYLYIPLGGKGKSDFQRSSNVIITMLVGGLWHGAGWTFVAWGGLHGFGIAANHLWRKIHFFRSFREGSAARFLYDKTCWAITFVFVSIAWVFFRADNFSDANVILLNLAKFNYKYITSGIVPDITNYYGQDQISFAAWLISQKSAFFINLCILISMTGITLFLKNSMLIMEKFKPGIISGVFCASVIFISIIINTFMASPNAFIYFRF
ncbi:MAG TPA: MBOAT family O-acyltransferase [Pseudomonadales bacterium]|nr:MBOAT family O-acyltransferase [Pseudomonadales bacterium]